MWNGQGNRGGQQQWTQPSCPWSNSGGEQQQYQQTGQPPMYYTQPSYGGGAGGMYDGGNQQATSSMYYSQSQPAGTLYDRLGGIFAIAAVVDKFSDDILKNNKVGRDSANPQLRDWSRNQTKTRLPGLKWMRTLWVASITGGPYQYVGTRPGSSPLGLENAHRNLKISPAEFDEVAKILDETLQHFKVGNAERQEVLAAFAAHKGEVTAGYFQNGGKQ